jgi:hypothetical protein
MKHRGALISVVPVLLIFAFSAFRPHSYYFLAAGPLCGIACGLAFRRKFGLPIVLGLCFSTIAFMFSLQDARSPLFSDVIWTGFVSGFLFWVAGGCAMLTLPIEQRFNGAAALAIPGAIGGMAFQFSYGPLHYLFDLASHPWWTDYPWQHLILWLIVGGCGGWLMGSGFETQQMAQKKSNAWAIASVVCGLLGAVLGASYFLRWTLPLGLFNSLSPSSAVSDWFWGWGVLGCGVALIAAMKRTRRIWTAAGLALAFTLIFTSYRVAANPWKTQFNSKYADKLLRDQAQSGDAIYAGNLILAQAALDNNDLQNAKRYLLQAAGTPGARRIEQNGLDVSVARVLFDRGEKDAVLEYLHRGRELWPQGGQIITRWEGAIRAGRRPNFNNRGGGLQGGGNQQ